MGRVTLLAACAMLGCGRVDFDARGDSDISGDVNSRYADVVLADGPFAYYRLGDPAGTTARDERGGADGRLVTSLDGVAAPGAPGALAGDPDTAARLTGTGNAGNGSVGMLEFPAVWPLWSGDWTFEAFVKIAAPAPGTFNMSLLMCERYTMSGFRTGWRSGSRLAMWSSESGGSDGFTIATALTPGTWTHVALVRRGSMAEIYLDGVLDTTQPFAYTTAISILRCGVGSFSGLPSDMTLDELAIYDRALTGAQIAAHVAAR